MITTVLIENYSSPVLVKQVLNEMQTGVDQIYVPEASVEHRCICLYRLLYSLITMQIV